MKMTDLKKQLSLMEKEELVNLICRLYKGSTQSRDMLDIELCGNDAERQVVEECKKQISKSFLIQNFSLKSAKKVISDFKKICHNKENLAELMLYYVECGVEFTNTYGDINESFYYSIETMYRNFVNKINSFTDDSYYIKNKKRIDEVYYSSLDIGWGFGDEIEDIHNEIKWRYNEG